MVMTTQRLCLTPEQGERVYDEISSYGNDPAVNPLDVVRKLYPNSPRYLMIKKDGTEVWESFDGRTIEVAPDKMMFLDERIKDDPVASQRYNRASIASNVMAAIRQFPLPKSKDVMKDQHH